MITGLAWLYAALCAGIVVFQLALIAGAPWGHLTQGGKNPGQLPPKARGTAALSVIGLVWMAMAILAASGMDLPFPSWTAWIALAMTGFTALANLSTPSAEEKRLWGPVTSVMLACALLVVLFG